MELINSNTECNRKIDYPSLKEQIKKIRAHLIKTGKMPAYPKDRPRIFVAVHHVNWEKHGLVDGWAEIADIIHYEWGDSFDQYAPDWHQKGKPNFNMELIRRVELAHRERPIDLFFAYLSGRWVYPETVQTIGKMNLITVNISLDDKLKFWGFQEASGLSGNAEIAPEFDFCITCQSAEDVHKYDKIGARSLFLPPGANPRTFSPLYVPRDIPVSFVGQCYGNRPRIITWLKDHGISVQTFGKGWSSAELSHQDMNVIYSRSLINLGFGYIGNSQVTGLKGRDFEVPLMEGLYLTTYNQDLENCFTIGEEIDCYRNETELLSKLQYYITHPDIALKIGVAGRNRCLREHTWVHKFKTILSIVGLSNHNLNQNTHCLLNKSKTHAVNFFNIAEQFAQKSQYEEAIPYYQKSIEADATLVNTYYNLALAYYRTNKINLAIKYFEKCIKLEPQNASAHNNLGVLYFSKGLLEEAETYFKKALSLEANYQEAQNNLEKVQQKLQSLPASNNSASNIETIHSQDTCSHSQLGIVLTTHFSSEAEYVVRHVCKTRNDIIAILVQRPQGHTDPNYEKRKQNFLKALCHDNQSITWEEITDINSKMGQELLRKLKPNLLLTIGGRVLKSDTIAIPKAGVINLHTSILPKYRGLASEFWALHYNDLQHIGVTVHYIDPGVDTGDIILQRQTTVDPGDNENTLRQKNMIAGAEALQEALNIIEQDKVQRKPQQTNGVIYCTAPTAQERQCSQALKYLRIQQEQVLGKHGKEEIQGLTVALTELTYGWRQILEQEGIPFEIYNLSEKISPTRYAAFIVNSTLSSPEIEGVRTYLLNGGSILTDLPNATKILTDIRISPCLINVIQPTNDNLFRHTEPLYLELPGYITSAANFGTLTDGTSAVLVRQVGSGHIIALPFDVDSAIMDTRSTYRYLAEVNNKNAGEVMSVVSKGGIRRLVTRALRYLFARRNLPYVHLWYYPGSYRSAFAFRVDSDGYEPNSFQRTFEAAQSHNIAMTWFIDVGAQINHFNHVQVLRSAGQDIQLHCFLHKTFDDYEQNFQNIRAAQQVMYNYGLSPVGFVAPFGTWHPNLNRAMEGCGITYSSEFSLAYDDLPFYPIINEKRLSRVLQVPVHVICLGNMLKAGYSVEEVQAYWSQIMKKCYDHGEPMFLYCHPIGRLGSYPEILDFIFHQSRNMDRVWFTTLTAFHEWWKTRLTTTCLARLKGKQLFVTTGPSDRTVFVRIVHPDGQVEEEGIRGEWTKNLSYI